MVIVDGLTRYYILHTTLYPIDHSTYVPPPPTLPSDYIPPSFVTITTTLLPYG